MPVTNHKAERQVGGWRVGMDVDKGGWELGMSVHSGPVL
jgi:hypothetical protein